MSKIVLKNPYVEVAGVDVSTEVQTIGIDYSAADVDATAGNADGVTERVAGLKDFSIDVGVRQNYTLIDGLMFGLVGADAFPVVVRPNAGPVSAANPQYSGNCIATAYSPLSGSIGDLIVTKFSMPGTGVLARTTA